MQTDASTPKLPRPVRPLPEREVPRLTAQLNCACRRCKKTKKQQGDYTVGKKYPFSCCGLVQMARA